MEKVQDQDQKALIRKPGTKITKEFLSMGSITNLKENKTLFIPCDCKSKILAVEYNHKTKIADFTIYENQASFTNRLSLWQRLRYCYQIIFKKKLYTDRLGLDNSQVIDLKKFLESIDL